MALGSKAGIIWLGDIAVHVPSLKNWKITMSYFTKCHVGFDGHGSAFGIRFYRG
jgi:hypothetical protein